jgi:hypothetical protein
VENLLPYAPGRVVFRVREVRLPPKQRGGKTRFFRGRERTGPIISHKESETQGIRAFNNIMSKYKMVIRLLQESFRVVFWRMNAIPSNARHVQGSA